MGLTADRLQSGEQVESIANAIVLELQRTPGVKVKISLDIEAEAPNGFDG
jgi:hypothetical protein